MVRIPGWALGKPLPSDLYRYAEAPAEQPVVKVNGEAVALNLDKGYVPISRTWKAGDTVEVSLPMPVHRVIANENIKDDIGRVAVERGPIVYCAEWTDNGGAVSNLTLDDKAPLSAEAKPEILNGITVDHGRGDGLSIQGREAAKRET